MRTAHITNHPYRATSVLNEEHARCNQSPLPGDLPKAFKKSTLGFAVLCLEAEGVLYLGNVAVKIVVGAMKLLEVLAGLVKSLVCNEPVWRSTLP